LRIAKHGKPLSDGDIVNETMLLGCKSLFHDFPNEGKVVLCPCSLKKNSLQKFRFYSSVGSETTLHFLTFPNKAKFEELDLSCLV